MLALTLTGTPPTADQRQQIVQYIRTHRVQDDAEFHVFARSIGVDPDDAEPVVYQLAHDAAWQVRAHHWLVGGLAALVGGYYLTRRWRR